MSRYFQLLTIVRNYISQPKYMIVPFIMYNSFSSVKKFTSSSVKFPELKKISMEDYDKYINIHYEKYEQIDLFDYLIMNCIHTENENTQRIIFQKIAKKTTPTVFREMKMKNELLCEEVIKSNPYNLIDVPYNLQTLKLCNLAIDLSYGDCLCFINPVIQTYEMALKCVKYKGINLEYVRQDLIDDILINTSLKSDGNAIKYVKNPSLQNLIDAITSTPSCITKIKDVSNELYMLAIKIDPIVLQFIDETKQTDEMCEYAVSNCNNYYVLGYVRNQTPKICKLAIKKNPESKMFVRNILHI